MLKVKKFILDALMYFFGLLIAKCAPGYLFSGELSFEPRNDVPWAFITAIIFALVMPRYIAFINKKCSS